MFGLDILRKAFEGNPTPDMARTLVTAMREASFTLSDLKDSTRHIDPRTASLQEIEDALNDCDFYWSTAYPETENDLVEWIEDECGRALVERFSQHGKTIMDKIKKRCPRATFP